MARSPTIETMKILGLDPAARTGWSHSTAGHGVITISNPNLQNHPGARLEFFRSFLYRIKRDHGVDVMAAEDAGFGMKINLHTVSMHHELRGIIKLCAAEWGIPCLFFKPAQLKLWLTGNGRASKAVMIRFVKHHFKVKTDDDNVADAVTVMELAKFMIAQKEKANGRQAQR